ncbi:hypothetical protein C8046_00065 [Serinibacter arcticus]|uniref:Uncharacterized protein n=1 Tax=Serinibacter arcticus TaxID=1655435 RepID=A0A2U2A0A6_9MICO|nr:hypothetical protein C8046_00065 [Serinibacter arcticus]
MLLTRRVREPLPRAMRGYGFAAIVMAVTLVGVALITAGAGALGLGLVWLAMLVDEILGWGVLLVPLGMLTSAVIATPLVFSAVHRRAERRAYRREHRTPPS